MSEQKEQKMVKVRILKHVGSHVPGDVVEVPEDQAEHLCQVSQVYHGQTIVEHKRAVRLDASGMAADGSDEDTRDISEMTLGEARAKGLLNRVASPAHDNDPVLKKAFEEARPVTLATQTPPHSSLPVDGDHVVPEVHLGLKSDKSGIAYDPVLAAEQAKKSSGKDGLKSAKKDEKATADLKGDQKKDEPKK